MARDIAQVGARLFRIHADALSEKLVRFSISEYTLFRNDVNLAGRHLAEGIPKVVTLSTFAPLSLDFAPSPKR